jgi:hypothetical protein
VTFRSRCQQFFKDDVSEIGAARVPFWGIPYPDVWIRPEKCQDRAVFRFI